MGRWSGFSERESKTYLMAPISPPKVLSEQRFFSDLSSMNYDLKGLLTRDERVSNRAQGKLSKTNIPSDQFR